MWNLIMDHHLRQHEMYFLYGKNVLYLQRFSVSECIFVLMICLTNEMFIESRFLFMCVSVYQMTRVLV